jgi:AraC-like DNA-binding protein
MAPPRLPRVSRSLMFAKSAPGLHAMVVSAGRQLQTEPSYDWDGLRRGSAPLALLQFTLAGGGMLRYQDRTHTLTPGDVMLLSIPHDHRYWLPAGGRWDLFYVCLNGSEVMRAWLAAIHRLGPVVRLPPTAPLLQCARRVCADVVHQRLTTPWQASAAAYTLTMELLALAMGQTDEQQRRRAPGIERAMAFCRDQPERRVTVTQLARVAGYSRCHFARVFARSEGLTPRQFLLNHRLSRAVRMIHTTSVPIKAIARDCGFYDPQHLCRVFRSVYGSTPGALRRTGMYGP